MIRQDLQDIFIVSRGIVSLILMRTLSHFETLSNIGILCLEVFFVFKAYIFKEL